MDVTTTLQERLGAAVAARRLLDHPFYTAWAEGRLTLDDLRFYASQYWRQVEAFPGYLETLRDRLEPGSQARAIVEANLADERDDDHPGLWLAFAAALGAAREDVRAATAEPETAACVDAFGSAMAAASLPFALGMLYGYESQTPAVAETKVAGLRTHYGVEDGLDYFTLHGELDVEHAAELVRALAEVAPNEPAVAEAEAGARAGAEAVWGLLDGVARVRALA
jgi:pyrroloquinoline-quinone synthase